MKSRIINESTSYKDKSVQVYRTEMPNSVMEFAMSLLAAHGISSAKPDGCTLSGAQKTRLLSPKECALRALEISEYLFTECESRGHLVKLPDLVEINTPAPE